jgi:predicted acyl esterase
MRFGFRAWRPDPQRPSPPTSYQNARDYGQIRPSHPTHGALALSAASVPSSVAPAPASPTPYPGRVWEPGPAKYGSTIADDVPVAMDDGIVLRASVAYPTDLVTGQRAPGLFPVVIEHTPYVRLAVPVTPITYFAEHGYISVVVRARGTGASGGEIQLYAPREGQDGKAIVDWAAHHLEGSDGRVAFLGCSYPGGIALTDAASVGPNSPLKAVVSSSNGLNALQRQAWLVGGVPTGGFNVYPKIAPSLMGDTPAATSFFTEVITDVMAGGEAAYDRAFYRDRLPMRLAQDIVDNGVPVLLWSGWADILDIGALRAYVALQNAYRKRPVEAPMEREQRTTPRYQIIMGGWKHGQGLDLGVYLEWFDTWLKGVDTGLQTTKAPMHLFESGTNRWINAARYPLVSRSTPWYLDGSQALESGVPQRSGSETLQWGDPDLPGSRLSFTTAPLRDGATLAGPISATIYASSSNTNLELIAKLYDVAPDGTATEITKGVVLGSQRTLDDIKSWTDPDGMIIWPWPTLQGDEYLMPGQVYRLDISLQPRQWGVDPDHRLRLELTTQPRADVCTPPANNDDPCSLTAPQAATLPCGTYRILHGPKWRSVLNLPQLPWKVFPAVAAGTTPTAWDESNRSLTSNGFALPLDWANDHKAEHGAVECDDGNTDR